MPTLSFFSPSKPQEIRPDLHTIPGSDRTFCGCLPARCRTIGSANKTRSTMARGSVYRSGVEGWCLFRRAPLLLQLLLVDLQFYGARTDELQVQDRFNYGPTDWIGHNYGPEDWNLVLCNNVATCPGWPTNWEKLNPFIPYNESVETCKNCANRLTGLCEDHRQSPIPLNRNVTAVRECVDRHFMHHGPGQCSLAKFDFQILPHVLRAYLPAKCPGEWPWIDFSMGFPDPWQLRFTDISVPSQHVQDGVRYDAEVVLSHVYSKNNPKKLIGNLAIFLERGKESDHYDFLELYIREWRATAKRVKDACGLRRRRLSRRRLQAQIDDVALFANATSDDPFTLRLDDDVWEPNLDDFLPVDDDYYVYDDTPQTDDRNLGVLIQKPYFNRYFHPYDWYVKAKTWYYFRYVGSMPEPPCFENVHWRVLKDPIKVAPQQLLELERLIASRIDPVTCERYTAGAPRFPNRNTWRVRVNRPLQTVSENHKLVYCECIDFLSRAENDVEYCKLNMTARGVQNYTNQSLIQ